MRLTLVSLLVLVACGKEQPIAGAVLINEIVPSNKDGTGLEIGGTFPDWVELFNPGEEEIDLEGWWLTDDLGAPQTWQFPPGLAIEPGRYLAVICDGDAGEGPNHTNFSLDQTGESIGLYDADGETVDEVTFGPIASDYAWARMPGEEELVIVWPPTPGAKNRLDPQPPGGAP